MQLIRYIFLGPLALLYGAVTTLRNWLYDLKLLPVYRSTLKVVSVGNLSAGGNSKTPLCIYLAKLYQEQGKRVVIVSRGYGGKAVGPYLVSPNDSADLVGDEPAMMARFYGLTVVVSARRKLALQKIEREGLGDLVILDDGFQHRAVARDLDIVTVNCATKEAIEAFNAGKLLPLGRFRERMAPALRRAQVLVLSSRSIHQQREIKAQVRDIPQRLEVVEASLRAIGVQHAITGAELSPCEIVAFCAIANPEGFFNSLEALGFILGSKTVLADHAPISAELLQRIKLGASGRALVCSEKDLVKIQPEDLAQLFVLRVKFETSAAGKFAKNY